MLFKAYVYILEKCWQHIPGRKCQLVKVSCVLLMYSVMIMFYIVIIIVLIELSTLLFFNSIDPEQLNFY